jgi:hypothetical protein
MADRRQPLLEHVYRLAARLDPEADAVLLDHFVRQHDQVAFGSLVHRYGAIWEMLQTLDEELQRLRESYRLPLILCCLEGRTQDEAAGVLRSDTPALVRVKAESAEDQSTGVSTGTCDGIPCYHLQVRFSSRMLAGPEADLPGAGSPKGPTCRCTRGRWPQGTGGVSERVAGPRFKGARRVSSGATA